MGWLQLKSVASDKNCDVPFGYFSAAAFTTYNAITPLEAEASRRLVETLKSRSGGEKLDSVMWAASGSEAIQKALWLAMARDRTRPMILATRHGFHGKKGLSHAVTGTEMDAERDPRVRFISFPMHECCDLSQRNNPFNPQAYQAELDALLHQFGRKIGTLITEPYLGGGGSYHPPKAYLQLLSRFCHEHDIVFILDEVQANFGRTGDLFAFETYSIQPDIVVLGKGLGNGVPVAAAVGRGDVFGSLNYGEASDTWSANPLSCAAVLATLDEFADRDILGPTREVSRVIEAGLVALKKFPFVAYVRGENGGMVWGVEFQEHDGKTANERANQFVLEAYRGEGSAKDGVHLLGPLAGKVVRISPPLIITIEEATAALRLLHYAAERMTFPAPHSA
jgi:4-aminobutyrate aminotransferase-like enzyme